MWGRRRHPMPRRRMLIPVGLVGFLCLCGWGSFCCAAESGDSALARAGMESK